MAVIYLDSNTGNDANAGTDRTAPKATAQAALTAAVAGDAPYRVWTRPTHNEVVAGATLTGPGTPAAPVEWYVPDIWQDNPNAIGSGALITSDNVALGFAGFCHCAGHTFRITGSNAGRSLLWTSGDPWWWRYDNCRLELDSTNANNSLSIGSATSGADDALLEFVNTKVRFANTGHIIQVRCPFIWRDTDAAVDPTGTIPTTLLAFAGSGATTDLLMLEALDLSALGSGKSLLLISGANHARLFATMVRIGAGAALVSGVPAGQGGNDAIFVGVSASGDPLHYYQISYQGEIQSSTAVYRNASAGAGGTKWAYRMSTFASKSRWASPLKFIAPMALYLDSIGAKNITAEFIHDSPTDLTDADIGAEVMVYGSSSHPKGTITSAYAAHALAAGAAHASSAEAWTTAGITNPRAQKMVVAANNAMKGPAYINAMLAKPGYTVWLCPDAEAA